MEKIFGIPMNTIMIVLLVLLAICFLAIAWIAWRRPVIFKIGVRNIPRRKAQTILIVIGLMLSTMIIAAALGTGDTIDYSFTVDIYKNLGEIDELVVYSQQPVVKAADSTTTIPDSALNAVDQAVGNDPNVDGTLALLQIHLPVGNATKNQGEPDVVLLGADPARIGEFGGIHAANGDEIDLASLGANEIVVSHEAADKLEAAKGDTIIAYYNNKPIQLTVAAIAKDSYLSGVRRSAATGLTIPGMVMKLADVQALTDQKGLLSSIAISNAGDSRSGVDKTDSVVDALTPALTGQSLGVEKTKANALDDSETFSNIFTGLFLVLGLFSIAAGILLIVLIFTMLAAERRSEMGMARAVGAQRSQLIQQFVSEGAGYAIIAGFVGALLGVVAAYGIGYAIKALFGEFVPVSPHVTLRSMVVAYCLGIVITFIAVIGSSWKISRLNVVSAIRDLPDVGRQKGRWRTVIWAALLLLFGIAVTLTGLSSSKAFPFYLGMSVLPFGVALVLRFFGISSRAIYTTVGAYILVLWLLPSGTADKLFGKLDGGFEMFFLSGIFMVLGSTIVIMQNNDVLLAGVTRLGGLFRSKLPAVRTAVAYPGASRGRTGLTIAMFSLIIFSLVMIATMNQNFVALFLGDEANAGWHVRADSIGANPISDFQSTAQQQGVDTSEWTAVGSASNPSTFTSQIRIAGTDAWKNWPVWGGDEGFLTKSKLFFQQRAEGYSTDGDIIKALQTEPDVAVIDSFALPGNGNFGGPADQFSLTGLSSSDKVFPPIMVELADPRTGQPHQVKIIGVIDSKIGSLIGLYANANTVNEIYPKITLTSYYVALSNPDHADQVAKSIESAMLRNGVQATSIEDQLKDSQRQSTGFLYIVQGFMGLGLVVGIAAIGVIAFRSVVERRQQIGVLRAIGFQRDLISLSFLIETIFVVGLGVIAGTALGIILARNLFTSDEVGSSSANFLVPWPIILTIAAVTLVIGLLMTWIPARQAAQIAPAEALRYE
ncbi:MAG: ABC transporter permease [Thermomicrobiales bacterium]